MRTRKARPSAVALLVLGLFSYGCDTGYVTYEIPEGYVGWAVVEFDVATCDTSSEGSRAVTIRLDESGKGCSSWPRVPETEIFQHFYVDEDGQRVRELEVTGWGEGGDIWAAQRQDEARYMTFFVGPEADLRTAWPNQPRVVPSDSG